MNKLVRGLGTLLVFLVLAWIGLQFYVKFRVDQTLDTLPKAIAEIRYDRVSAYPWGELRFRDLNVRIDDQSFTVADARFPLVIFNHWPRNLRVQLDGIVWRDSYESGEIASVFGELEIIGDKNAPTILGQISTDGIRLPAEAWSLPEDETRLLNWAAGWTGIPGNSSATLKITPTETRVAVTTELTGLYRTEQRLVTSGWKDLMQAGLSSGNLTAALLLPERIYLQEWFGRWQDLGFQQRLLELRGQQAEVAKILDRDLRRIKHAAKVMRAQQIDRADLLASAIASTGEPYSSHEIEMRPLTPVPLMQPLRALLLWQQGEPELLAAQAAIFGLEMRTKPLSQSVTTTVANAN